MNKERKTWLLHQIFTSILFFVLFIYASYVTISLSSIFLSNRNSNCSNCFPPADFTAPPHVRVYLYDLPRKFTYGVVQNFWLARGFADVDRLKYPNRHQHSAEWHLFLDLSRPESERVGSLVTRVVDPNEADLFYVPFFSSLSSVVNKTHILPGSGQVTELVYDDAKAQEELVAWLEEQEYWRRSNGKDHVLTCQDPNALDRVMSRVNNAILLVSDFGRVRFDQASLVKDVVLPDSHRISGYNGDIDFENRKTLLFFKGNRHRQGVKKYLDYNDPNGAVNEIWRQVSQKLPLIKLMTSRDKRLAMMHVTQANFPNT